MIMDMKILAVANVSADHLHFYITPFHVGDVINASKSQKSGMASSFYTCTQMKLS